MVKIIFQFIFVGSLAGMGAILLPKMPFLVKISPAKIPSFKEFGQRVAENFSNLPFLKNISFVKFLEKALLRLRILTLKAENQTTSLLQKLKEKSQKADNIKDNYWEELRRAKGGK